MREQTLVLWYQAPDSQEPPPVVCTGDNTLRWPSGTEYVPPRGARIVYRRRLQPNGQIVHRWSEIRG